MWWKGINAQRRLHSAAEKGEVHLRKNTREATIGVRARLITIFHSLSPSHSIMRPEQLMKSTYISHVLRDSVAADPCYCLTSLIGLMPCLTTGLSRNLA
jgi:hypothetical protein